MIFNAVAGKFYTFYTPYMIPNVVRYAMEVTDNLIDFPATLSPNVQYFFLAPDVDCEMRLKGYNADNICIFEKIFFVHVMPVNNMTFIANPTESNDYVDVTAYGDYGKTIHDATIGQFIRYYKSGSWESVKWEFFAKKDFIIQLLGYKHQATVVRKNLQDSYNWTDTDDMALWIPIYAGDKLVVTTHADGGSCSFRLYGVD